MTSAAVNSSGRFAARRWSRAGWALLAIALCAGSASAQSVPVWPEADALVKLNSKMRLDFLAKTVEEERETTSGEFGVNVDLYHQPIRKKPELLFRLDESKNRLLTLRAGYHYLPSYTGHANENRGILELTMRYPLMAVLGDVLISDRNRADFRLIEGAYSWRYRNKLSVERELSMGRARINPYVSYEFYYDSRYDAWSRTELMAGASSPVSRRWEVDAYFDFQDDSSSNPSKHTKALGVSVKFYVRK